MLRKNKQSKIKQNPQCYFYFVSPLKKKENRVLKQANLETCLDWQVWQLAYFMFY